MSDTPVSQIPGATHDILRLRKNPLEVFFTPKSVAVIGASEEAGSVGRTLMWNLVTNPFGGTVFPVNPARSSVLGVKAYPSVSALPERPELAVISTPAESIPGIVRECAESGVQGAIVISAGFKELGPGGLWLEQCVVEEATKGKMRIIGPNCLGVMRPVSRFNATFAKGLALPGKVAFISQSGALCTAVLDWSLKERVGFSGFVSIGSMSDVGWTELIEYFGRDHYTESILMYMETVGDARSFLSAAREVALTKPIIVIKVGRTAAAAKAATSHTGSLTGSDEVLDAAFSRCGVLRVNRISDLFYMAEVLSKQPRPRGPRLTVVTNAGGPGVLATDALILNGGELSEISGATMEKLNAFLPAAWSHHNPIDILGDASPERYARALEVAAKDPNSDGVMVILTPQDMTDPTATAECLKPYAHFEGKAVLASWMGGNDVAEGEAILNRAGIPTFPYPDTAALAFTYMWRNAENLKALYETPALPTDSEGAPDRALVEKLVDGARLADRTLLTEHESKEILAAYHIPALRGIIARTPDEAVRAAEKTGYPVALKLFSRTITHKTEVGGVRLDLGNARAVEGAFEAIRATVAEKMGPQHFIGVSVQPMVKLDGYEVILGASPDPQFGPVLLFGAGGQLVEVFKDRALGLPPLTTTLARRMMERTKIHSALKGVRGRRPVDLPALEQLMVRFSQLVVEQPLIKEIDVNPLLVSPEGLLALDARVVVHGRDQDPKGITRPAIAPYPAQYASQWRSAAGRPFTIRPVRPEDEPQLAALHGRLSDRTVYHRYAEQLKLSARVAHERLTRVCFIDYEREMTLVAERDSPGERRMVAASRLMRLGGNESEFSIVLDDECQGQGLGTEILRRQVQIARDLGFTAIRAETLSDNIAMVRVFRKVGFEVTQDAGGGVRVELRL